MIVGEGAWANKSSKNTIRRAVGQANVWEDSRTQRIRQRATSPGRQV